MKKLFSQFKSPRKTDTAIAPFSGSRNLFSTLLTILTKKDVKSYESAREILKNLQKNNRNLSNSAKDFESKFSSVLHTLDSLENTSSQLTKESKLLLTLCKSEDNPILNTNSVLDPFLTFMMNSGQKIEIIVDQLLEDESKMDETLSGENRLNQTFSQLTYLRTLFAVEAAPLDQHVKDMFNSLVDEIYRLQMDVTEIFKVNFEKLRDHRSTITRLTSNLGKQASHQLKTLNQKRKESTESLELMKNNLESAIHSNADLNSSIHEINESIGEAIISLQAQDIINQKLQHMFELSREMEERFNSITPKMPREVQSREMRFIENVSVIQINQIRNIKSEVKDSEEKIKSSLEFIALSIGHIKHSNTNSDNSGNQKSAFQENSEEQLKSTIRETESIIDKTEKTAKDAFTQIEPIRGMASNVTERILELSFQLHLIGLNAEVHAARVGAGSGLETISSNTSMISLETRKLCQEVSTNLDSLAHSLNKSVSEFEELHKESESKNAEISEIAPKLKDKLENYQDCTRKSSSMIDNLIVGLIDLIDNSNAELNIGQRMINDLDTIEKDLSALSQSAKQCADSTRINVDISDMMNELLSRYTMESEKSVHFDALGLPYQAPERTDNSPVEEFNDVVFFEDDSPEATVQDGFESFEFDRSPTVPEEVNDRGISEEDDVDPKKKDNSSDFGNNVELF